MKNIHPSYYDTLAYLLVQLNNVSFTVDVFVRETVFKTAKNTSAILKYIKTIFFNHKKDPNMHFIMLLWAALLC